MPASIIIGIGDEVLITLVVVMLTFLIGFIRFSGRDYIVRFIARVRESFADEEFDPPSTSAARPGGDAQILPENAEVACPICLGPFMLEVETNCGHNFCASCIRLHFLNATFSGITCPLCRQQVTLLFNSYTEEERNAAPTTEIGRRRIETNIFINRFNRTSAGTPRTLIQNVRDWPVLLRRLMNEFLTQWPNTFFHLHIMLMLTVLAVYVLSPFDVLSEAIYGFVGLLDDALVILFCTWYIMNLYRAFLAEQDNFG